MKRPKLAAPPLVAPETWRALLAAATEFAALEPWEFACDCDLVGLIDPVSGETRIGHVLGNAGEVFAAVFYRREGLRWILSMFAEESDPLDANVADGMDCLKVEFVPKRELDKDDLAVLKAAAFKPAGRGCVWPQFRSSEPGWHPWYIHQTEAEQLLADLPRLTAFYRLFEKHTGLFDDRAPTEIPFLPGALPSRLLTPEDLDWRPLLLLPPVVVEPFRASADQLDKLRAFEQKPGLGFEFDCTLVPGGSFVENGRVCFGRISLLVERQSGLIAGMNVQSGGLVPGEAAGRGLVETLLMARALPEQIFIAGTRLQPALQPLCDELQIRLQSASPLPALAEAVAGLNQYMSSGRLPRMNALG